MPPVRPSEFDKALGVFRDVLALLDRYGRSWYTEELRARGRIALQVLGQTTDRVRSSELASHMPDRRNDLLVNHEKGDPLKLKYSHEKLYMAVRSAIRSEQPLHRRLLDCYLELYSLGQQGYLPPDLQKRLDAMADALTRRADTTGEKWVAAATLETMCEDEVRKWMDETLNLFVEVVRRKALAELQ